MFSDEMRYINLRFTYLLTQQFAAIVYREKQPDINIGQHIKTSQ